MEEERQGKQDNNKTITQVKPRAKEQFPSSFPYVKRSLEEEELWEILPTYRKAVNPSIYSYTGWRKPTNGVQRKPSEYSSNTK